jgi:hypothetical protein
VEDLYLSRWIKPLWIPFRKGVSMKKTLALLALMTTPAWANLNLAPPDFVTEKGRAIFVDFKTAQYDLSFDLLNQTTTVRSKINFHATKIGKPLFDLVNKPKSLKLDGVAVTQVEITLPGKASKMRLVDLNVVEGDHVLEMENSFSANTTFSTDATSVASAFWIRDLTDRYFLEQYVPSNLEFDQYQMTLNVNFVNGKKLDQEFFTNGVLTQKSPSSYTIEFPEYFTVSCPFFHTNKKGTLRRLDYEYTSVSGRKIPMTVYSEKSKNTADFKTYSLEVMAELENDYGAWGHPAFIAYGTGTGLGGMEHSGATATNLDSLDHEMLHSYFAKGVMPARGNAGWIDEAIASWRDKGYLSLSLPGFNGSDLGAGTTYKRNTDKRAYDLGAKFMAYLDYRLHNVGGLKAFLKGYFSAYKHTVITQEHLKNNLEFFSGLDLTQDFNTYVWGTNSKDSQSFIETNPHHPHLSENELKSML